MLIPSFDKEKMIKYTVSSVAGIARLLTIGIVGLIESRMLWLQIIDAN